MGDRSHPPRHRGVPLLEREHELAVIEEALDGAAAGRGSVVAIEGEPGIGKSELLGAGVELAGARAMGSFRARGSEIERSIGSRLVRALSENVAGVAPGAWGPTSDSAVNTPADRSDRLEPANEPPTELTLARGFQELVASCAKQQPLLLGVDDAHWADSQSLRALLYLAHRIEELPVVLCLATRPPTDSLTPLIDALLAEARTQLLHPTAFSPEATAALLPRMLGAEADPAFCSACHDATGGNPLLLRELARGLLSEGVAPIAENRAAILETGGLAVSRTVRLRLSHLPDAATRLAQAAALLGDGASIARAAEVARLDSSTAFEAAGRLGQLEILSGGPEIEFVHPLIREGVLADLSTADAAELHESAARVLAASGAPQLHVAQHLLHAPPRASEKTVRTLRAAADAAVSSGEAGTAAALLARALEEPPPQAERPAILLELAVAEHFIDHAAAKAHAEAALQLIRDPAEQASAALQLGGILPVTDPGRAIEVVEPHVDQLPDPESKALGRALILMSALLAPDRRELAYELAETLRPEAGADSTPARMAASLVGYHDALANRPASEVMAVIESAALPLEPDQVLGPLCLGMMALIAAESTATLTIAEEWSALAGRTGLAGETTGALMARSHALLAHGRLGQALAAAREGVEIAELYVGGASVNWIGAALVEAAIEVGELDEAERALSRHEPIGSAEWMFDLHGLLICRARLDAARGDTQLALERTLELGRLCEEAELRNPALSPWRSRAALLIGALRPGDEQALRLAEEEVKLARTWGAPRAIGRSLSALAAVSDGAEAIELHEEAIAALEDSPARHELARAQLAYGIELRSRRKRAAAREPLRRAVELAESCCAAPVAARARSELVAAGARPRRPAVSGVGALTPRERDVAARAAEGCSNAEIAAQLHLTVRTVESHLSNTYGKLEISSRSQLADLLKS